MSPDPAANTDSVPFWEAFRVWCRVAALSFGGPAGQIAVMHRILVDEKRWINEQQFIHALNYCMLLPGPEAQQLATYIGWLLHRTLGGLVAGILFILPGFISILFLSILYAEYQQTHVVQALFFGIKPAVLAIVIQAVIRMSGRVLKSRWMLGIAVVSFVAIFFINLPFPLLIAGAGLIGFFGGRWAPDSFLMDQGKLKSEVASQNSFTNNQLNVASPTLRRNLSIIAIFSVLWIGPLLLMGGTLGHESVYTQEGIFFSKAAVVTFGGAYSVLSYIAQQAVEHYEWLHPEEMLDGLGMAESTPGPLIQVVQFVGFMGAYRDPAPLSPVAAGIAGSIVTTWVTFVPCFLWIFLGAPYIERLRGNRVVTAALSAITAAVVGVIVNLAVWFSLHTLFGSVQTYQSFGLRLIVPDPSSLQLGSCLVAFLALSLLFYFRRSVAVTLLASVLFGIFVYYVGAP